MCVCVRACSQAFGKHLWSHELAYAQTMIGRDVRNNSAWNQRAFVLRHRLGVDICEWDMLPTERKALQQDPSRVLLARELEYVGAQVRQWGPYSFAASNRRF